MHSLTLHWTVDGQAHTHTLAMGQTMCIGRRSDCDIVLQAPTVSRQHAFINTENNVFVVRNFSRTNAVHINEREQLAPDEQRVLQPGDTLRVGPVQFQVTIVSAPLPVLKILCATCGRTVDYNPESYCPWCGTALSAGSTIIASKQ